MSKIKNFLFALISFGPFLKKWHSSQSYTNWTVASHLQLFVNLFIELWELHFWSLLELPTKSSSKSTSVFFQNSVRASYEGLLTDLTDLELRAAGGAAQINQGGHHVLSKTDVPASQVYVNTCQDALFTACDSCVYGARSSHCGKYIHRINVLCSTWCVGFLNLIYSALFDVSSSWS